MKQTAKSTIFGKYHRLSFVLDEICKFERCFEKINWKLKKQSQLFKERKLLHDDNNSIEESLVAKKEKKEKEKKKK